MQTPRNAIHHKLTLALLLLVSSGLTNLGSGTIRAASWQSWGQKDSSVARGEYIVITSRFAASVTRPATVMAAPNGRIGWKARQCG